MERLGVSRSNQKKRQFLNRLQGELAKRGVIDVLRNGIKVYPVDLILFYLTPTEGNEEARKMFARNIFSVTRQLRYSPDVGKLALESFEKRRRCAIRRKAAPPPAMGRERNAPKTPRLRRSGVRKVDFHGPGSGIAALRRRFQPELCTIYKTVSESLSDLTYNKFLIIDNL